MQSVAMQSVAYLNEVRLAQYARGVRKPVRIVQNDQAARPQHLQRALRQLMAVGRRVDDHDVECPAEADHILCERSGRR